MNADPATGRYRYLVVITLAATYMFNFMDRQLLSILAQPIKNDLHLSDTSLGLLTGLAFALFYTVFGIPLALIADRWRRVKLLAISCGLWSLFTAASGLATSFATLALARVGVGIGEAGASPPSFSLISDYFRPDERGRAIAIYTLGVPAGGLVGALAGGSIAAAHGWRAAFFTVGAAGLLLAPLVPLIIREPRRGRLDPSSAVSDSSAAPAGSGVRFFVGSPTLVLSALSSGLTAFVSYGIFNWAPAYLGRAQGMSLLDIAGKYSIAVAGSLVTAALLGGWIADRLGSRNPVNYALVPGIGALLSIPFLFAVTAADGWPRAVLFLVGPLVLTSIYLIPALALLQNRTPPEHRATASAVLLFLINLIGIGGGPVFVGAISDHLTPTLGSAVALGTALRWLSPFLVFAFLCQAATAWSIARERG